MYRQQQRQREQQQQQGHRTRTSNRSRRPGPQGQRRQRSPIEPRKNTWIHPSLHEKRVNLPTWVKEISSPHLYTLEKLTKKLFRLTKVVENLQNTDTVLKSCKISNKPAFPKQTETFQNQFNQHIKESEKTLHKIVVEGKKAELELTKSEVKKLTSPAFYHQIILEHVTAINLITVEDSDTHFWVQTLQEAAFNIVTHAQLLAQQEFKKKAEKAAKLEEARRRIENMTNQEAINFAIKKYAPRIIQEEVRKVLRTSDNGKKSGTTKDNRNFSRTFRRGANGKSKNGHRRGDQIWPKPRWIRRNNTVGRGRRRNRGLGRARNIV